MTYTENYQTWMKEIEDTNKLQHKLCSQIGGIQKNTRPKSKASWELWGHWGNMYNLSYLEI